MGTMGFKQPSSSSGPDFKALYGSLLLITPKRMELRQTKFGEKEALIADMVVLDGEHAGEVYENFPVWGVVLQDQLKPLINVTQQLGRLTQGVATAGHSAPWVLDGFTDADEALAAAYLKNGAIGVAVLGETTDEAPPLGDDDYPPSDDSEPPF
jgi:hypothetical protein